MDMKETFRDSRDLLSSQRFGELVCYSDLRLGTVTVISNFGGHTLYILYLPESED